MSGWQTIDSAPKNGSRIQLWTLPRFIQGHAGYATIGSFREYERGVESWRADSGASLHPTHWQPLPEPPQ